MIIFKNGRILEIIVCLNLTLFLFYFYSRLSFSLFVFLLFLLLSSSHLFCFVFFFSLFLFIVFLLQSFYLSPSFLFSLLVPLLRPCFSLLFRLFVSSSSCSISLSPFPHLYLPFNSFLPFPSLSLSSSLFIRSIPFPLFLIFSFGSVSLSLSSLQYSSPSSLFSST